MNELELQNSFVEWLSRTQGYLENHTDRNGGDGARCDSVGAIAGVPILLEFKCSITPSMVEYSPTRGTSLERKVRNTLEALHNRKLLPSWDKTSLPLIWVIAERISASAIQEMHRVFSSRAHDWFFVYESGVWSGCNYTTCGKGPPIAPSLSQIRNVIFLPMVWPGETRLPRRDRTALRAIAEERGVQYQFDVFMQMASGHALRLQCNRDNLNLKALHPNRAQYLNVISVWPGDSGGEGLCVAADSPRLQQCFPDRSDPKAPPPGTIAPYRGHMGQRTYLSTEEDIVNYWIWAIGHERHSKEQLAKVIEPLE